MATEKRLIDANAYPCQNCEVSYCYKNCKKFNSWLNDTVDAVEVVRCKDCDWWLDGKCSNVFAMVSFDENNFCSYGERRTEDG